MLPFYGQIVACLAFLVMGLLPLAASATEPRRPKQENFLSRALFADGQLWLLSDEGQLSSITPGKDARVDDRVVDPVLDACVQGGHLKVLVASRGKSKTWAIRTRKDGKWDPGRSFSASEGEFVALHCVADRDIVLSTRQLTEIVGAKQTVVALSQELRMGMVTSVQLTGNSVLVGVNAGEWGGGLRRIDRATGKVFTIEKNATGGLCDGPLNTKCDPVNGIVAEPWQPQCVALAIGLVHFSPHGRVVEVCGENVRRLYFKAYGKQSGAQEEKGGDEPFETVAFFGVVPAGDAILVAGIDGVYRLDGKGEVTVRPLPKFREIGGIGVSFDLPDVILVLTAINQRRSISGNVPLLVPR